MLFLRIDEQVVEGDQASAPAELLRTDSCSRAAETLRAFSACGTSVEAISGELRLTRRGRDEGEAVTWGKTGDSRERRERDEPTPELAATSLVFLPAIPSWLPLWGLLSPADAVSGGGDKDDASGNSRNDSTLSSSDNWKAEPETKAPNRPVIGKASQAASVFDGEHKDDGGQDKGGHGQDTLSDLDKALGKLAVTDGERSGGRGAVRFVQTVSSPRAPYRYAAVLHFWDVDDAASFVNRFNGLSLPDRTVMKALFLSGIEVVAAGGAGRNGGGSGGGFGAVNLDGGDGELSTRRRRKRRSLSEGVSSVITAAAAAAASLRGVSGSEEFKSSWAGGASTANPDSSWGSKGPPSPPRDPDDDDRSAYLSGTNAADSHQRGRGAARSMAATSAAAGELGGGAPHRVSYGLRRLRNRRSESASPSPPVRETDAEERKGRDNGNRWRQRGGGLGQVAFDSLSPPPGLKGGEIFMPLSGGGVETSRPGLAWGGAAVAGVGGGYRRDVSGGSGAGFSAQIELPPCPVCFDRLDPAVSGIPAARFYSGARGSSGAGISGDTGVAISGSLARCNHKGCNLLGNAAAGEGKPAARTGKQAAAASSGPQPKGGGDGCGCGSDKDTGRGTSCAAHGGNTTGRGKHGGQREHLSSGAGATPAESRGPRWEGEKAREGEAPQNEENGVRGQRRRGGGGGGGGHALNTVIWKGSTCRVCRSLNVALEGAPEEMFCETCRIAHNLWICMVCGHIGCGRYTKEHAKEHFCLSGHSYSLELSTGRVWDYTGDCYAHRALRGHLASSPEGGAIGGNDYGRRESHDRGGGSSSANYGGARGAGGAAAAGAAAGGGSGGRDGSPPLYSEGQHEVFDEQGNPSSMKVAVVSREYEALVARQLQEQQRYFEDLIATAIAADAEANAPTEEVLTEEERREVGELRQAVDGLSDKYDTILDSLRQDEETARRVRSENRGLVAEQRHQKQEEARLIEEARQTKRQCEDQMAELEGQMQDLLFFLKAQEEVKSGPRREELVGGSVVMGEGSAGPVSSGNGRGGGKETERERLARRLKERSHSRRAGSKGTKPGR